MTCVRVLRVTCVWRGVPGEEARRVASLEKLREDMREGGGRGEKVVMDMNNKTPEQEADSDDDDDDDDDNA